MDRSRRARVAKKGVLSASVHDAGKDLLVRSGEGEEARAMVAEAAEISGDLEQLRRRFEEFRATRSGRSRFPAALWTAAAEAAKRHGVNRTAQVLRLEYGGLRKRVENQAKPKAKSKESEPPSFLEFIAPGAKPVTNCTVEVESAQGGKLRLELKAIATTELVHLIRAFVSQ